MVGCHCRVPTVVLKRIQNGTPNQKRAARDSSPDSGHSASNAGRPSVQQDPRDGTRQSDGQRQPAIVLRPPRQPRGNGGTGDPYNVSVPQGLPGQVDRQQQPEGKQDIRQRRARVEQMEVAERGQHRRRHAGVWSEPASADPPDQTDSGTAGQNANDHGAQTGGAEQDDRPLDQPGEQGRRVEMPQRILETLIGTEPDV